MSTLRSAAVGVLLAVATAGCQGTAGPNWLHPGPAPYQQQRAVQFDPYPENDTGPPVVGGRPRGYETPLPEVDRARQVNPTGRSSWLPWNWGRS